MYWYSRDLNGNFWWQKNSKSQRFSVKHENHEIIIDTLWRSKIRRLSRYNPFRVKKKTSQEFQKDLQKFLESTRKTKSHFYRQFLRIWQVLRKLSWNFCTLTSHRPETNGIPERAVRGVQEVTSAVLLQSGLDEKWWASSMGCHCETFRIFCLVPRLL